MDTSFFSAENLDKYRNNKRIHNYLQNKMDGSHLLNSDEIYEYFTSKGANKREKSSILYKLVEFMGSELCPTIHEEYGQQSINNALNKNSLLNNLFFQKIKAHYPSVHPTTYKGYIKKSLQYMNFRIKNVPDDNHQYFDLLVLVRNGYKNASSLNEQFDQILGFIVVEFGECITHPSAYAIQLICARYRINEVAYTWMKSYIFLGAYLCIIKGLDCEQIGILELVDGYNNIPGLCAYSKFGFREDESLEERGCFPNIDNLAMSVHLSGITINNIIDVVVDSKIVRKEDDYDLCQKFIPKTKEQAKIQSRIAGKYQYIKSNRTYTNTETEFDLEQDKKLFYAISNLDRMTRSSRPPRSTPGSRSRSRSRSRSKPKPKPKARSRSRSEKPSYDKTRSSRRSRFIE